MTAKHAWVKAGNDYYSRSVAQNIPKLPVGVYLIKQDPRTKELMLEFLKEKYEFPFKIYGIEDAFIKRVVKTYHAMQKNLGVMLNGVKGTGKSVTAELIANALDLPVVLVTYPHPDLVEFMNSFTQDAVFFLDRYLSRLNPFNCWKLL